jgi:hypothetical protein
MEDIKKKEKREGLLRKCIGKEQTINRKGLIGMCSDKGCRCSQKRSFITTDFEKEPKFVKYKRVDTFKTKSMKKIKKRN